MLWEATAAAAAKSLQSCPTLCDPIDGSPPGSPVHGIFQAGTRVGCHCLLQCVKVKSESEVAQFCLTFRDPMDCSPPGSSTHGIFQARVLEWVAIAFSECRLMFLNFRVNYKWWTCNKATYMSDSNSFCFTLWKTLTLTSWFEMSLINVIYTVF